MRDDRVLLADIAEAASRVLEFIGTMSREEFLEDRKTQAAVVHEIAVMGEAASQVSTAFRETHGDVQWTDLVQLRNFYIHAYHRVDYRRVWRYATVRIPQVLAAIGPLLTPEPPPG